MKIKKKGERMVGMCNHFPHKHGVAGFFGTNYNRYTKTSIATFTGFHAHIH